MGWVMGMQRAIDYVEAHITEELDYDEIARQGYSTAYHFQRVFGLLCGYTLGEYIRNRRLTLAGGEIIGLDKQLEALKKGEDTAFLFETAPPRRTGMTHQYGGEGAPDKKDMANAALRSLFGSEHRI